MALLKYCTLLTTVNNSSTPSAALVRASYLQRYTSAVMWDYRNRSCFHLSIPPGTLPRLNSTACRAKVIEAQADRDRARARVDQLVDSINVCIPEMRWHTLKPSRQAAKLAANMSGESIAQNHLYEAANVRFCKMRDACIKIALSELEALAP